MNNAKRKSIHLLYYIPYIHTNTKNETCIDKPTKMFLEYHGVSEHSTSFLTMVYIHNVKCSVHVCHKALYTDIIYAIL